jgi:NAD(P)-dependent dehydrogenase (short-subunit alcohol dehydrogenase family)
MLLEGKTVVITGVGSGLGREIASLCVADGANVVIGARTRKRLEEVAADVDASGEHVELLPTDIKEDAQCEAIVDAAEKRFGRVDGMVQVAAFELAVGNLAESDFQWWREAIDVNLIGSVQMLKAAAASMKKTGGGGSAVWIGSQSLYLPAMPQAGYAASKGALLSAMYYFAKELAPDRIRLNTILPSWMWGPQVELYTKMQASTRGIPSEEVKAEIIAGIPMGEIVPDEDVAQAVGFMLSDRARMITGQSLAVNGGEWMR